MSRNPILANLIISSAVWTAAAHGSIDGDPQQIIDALAPAVEQIEHDASGQLDALRAQLEAERASHAAERVAWEAERRVLMKLRAAADKDCATLTGLQQKGPLARPHHFYVYFLWGSADKLLYVGMSTNILSRLGTHLTNPARRTAIRRITTQECPDEATLRRAEARAIWTLCPEWNVAGVVV